MSSNDDYSWETNRFTVKDPNVFREALRSMIAANLDDDESALDERYDDCVSDSGGQFSLSYNSLRGPQDEYNDPLDGDDWNTIATDYLTSNLITTEVWSADCEFDMICYEPGGKVLWHYNRETALKLIQLVHENPSATFAELKTFEILVK